MYKLHIGTLMPLPTQKGFSGNFSHNVLYPIKDRNHHQLCLFCHLYILSNWWSPKHYRVVKS